MSHGCSRMCMFFVVNTFLLLVVSLFADLSLRVHPGCIDWVMIRSSHEEEETAMRVHKISDCWITHEEEAAQWLDIPQPTEIKPKRTMISMILCFLLQRSALSCHQTHFIKKLPRNFFHSYSYCAPACLLVKHVRHFGPNMQNLLYFHYPEVLSCRKLDNAIP